MFKMRKFIFLILIFIVLLLIFFANNNRVGMTKYDLYSEITKSDGIHTWLPDFFPKSARNIAFKANVEDDYFLITFSLNENDALDFEKQFFISTSERGDEYIKEEEPHTIKRWCKSGRVPEQGSEQSLYFTAKLSGSDYVYLITGFPYKKHSPYFEQTPMLLNIYCDLSKQRTSQLQ